MTPIDVINKAVLLSVFLIGFLSGGVLAYIIQSINESRKREVDR